MDNGNDLITASMLAAFAYCPRLCYLQFVQGEFLDSAELADGRFQHRWIDAEQDAVAKGLLAALRSTIERGEVPPPLQASARCDRCSRHG